METDLFQVLRREHRRVLDIFDRGRETVGNDGLSRELFETFSSAVESLALREESLLYPRLSRNPEFLVLLQSADEGFSKIESLIEELRVEPFGTLPWKSMFLELGRLVRHHFEEEENKAFPKMREQFEDQELHALARRYLEAESARAA